jgi:hypothetical protein
MSTKYPNKPPFVVVIAGSRNVKPKQRAVAAAQIRACLNQLIHDQDLHGRDVLVATGGARGIDLIGEECAKLRGLIVRTRLPEWNRWGKAAGKIRNREMIVPADGLIAIWDGMSSGTAHAIATAKLWSKKIWVYELPNEEDLDGVTQET